MDSETIRTTISPIFFFCSLSFTVGIIAGIFIGLLDLTYLLISIIIVTVTGITFFSWYERRLRRKKK